jgi:lantibiotic modifying enzyme
MIEHVAEILRQLTKDASRVLASIVQRHPWLASAVPGLEAQLIGRLYSIANVPLYLWFRVHCESAHIDAFTRFCEAMRSDDRSLRSGLFREYPELARLLFIVVEQWQASSLEFLERLGADRCALAQFLGVSELRLESVFAGLSDAHDHGRTVIKLVFLGGHQVAYKPRSLESEVVWARLVRVIADRDPSLKVPHAAVLSRPTHGWMVWLTPSASADAADWYSSAGGVHCLFQALGTVDAHMANCVGTAVGPALIDCECLLTPRMSDQSAGGDEVESMLTRIRLSMFLPDPQRAAGEPDLSGLFGQGGQSTGYRIPVWTQDSSGEVELNFRPAVLRSQANLLPDGVEPISGMAACAAFLNGFSRMHAYLATHSREALAALGPLRNLHTRVLLRNTRRYTDILSRSVHPRYLRNRQERRRLIVTLLEHEPLEVSPAVAMRIIEAEAEALERLDIPFFHASGHDLISEDQCIARGLFASSGYEDAAERLSDLAEVDLAKTLTALRLLWIMSL